MVFLEDYEKELKNKFEVEEIGGMMRRMFMRRILRYVVEKV